MDAEPLESRTFAPTSAGTPSFWCRALGDAGLYASSHDAQPLVGVGKPLAVLVYLALSPDRRASRDRLAELLWRSASLADARHSLRQSLYRLRHATGVELIRARGEDLTLLPIVRLDCLDGEAAAASGDLVRACELLRGRFLEGFSVSESVEFETWADSQRSRFDDLWIHAASALATHHLENQDPRKARDLAERLAALCPFDDGPIRLLMAALAELGRHAAALSRFHAYADLLASELEEKPGDALLAYAAELEAFLRSRALVTSRDLPFVGREGQWAALEGAWKAAEAASGSALLIEGAAGLGKTRLISELVNRAKAAGGLVLDAKCYDIERTVPYGAIADALSGALDRPELRRLSPAWLAEAARLLPELRERFEDLPSPSEVGSSPASKRRLHQALARCFETLSTERTLLVVIDDLHWADVPSLEVLHFLCQRLANTKVLIAGSYRPAELSPGARRFARSLLFSKVASLLVLEPLTADDVTQLLAELGRFDAASVGRVLSTQLYRHSGGSPLFLSELLEALARDRVLWVQDGRWHMGPRAKIEDLPSTLGKVLSDRIDTLDPLPRVCAETLAVAAGETSAEVIAKVLNISEPRAELALGVLGEERLISPSGTGAYELIHDELRRLLYQGIPDDRRRMLHAGVGAALEAFGEERRAGGAARLAYHFDQAADTERAHRYALLAAGEAGTLSAPEEARAHLEIATAHSPAALPPGPLPHESGAGFRRWIRGQRTLTTAAAVVLALIGGTAFGLIVLRSGTAGGEEASGYRQGTLYLSGTGTFGPTHSLRWPPDAGQTALVEELSSHPEELPPLLVSRDVSAAGETHGKLFLIQADETVQLTDGHFDDGYALWSPDGRSILLQRGWRASEARYQSNLFLLDPQGDVVRQITGTRYQDVFQAWSPTGAQIAFIRDSAGVSSLWLADADGANARELTGRFGLPGVRGQPAFSPDGRRLAVLYPDDGSGRGALYLLDLTEGVGSPLFFSGAPDGYPVWSPDGRWIAFLRRTDDGLQLWALPVDGQGGQRLLTTLSERLQPSQWTDGTPRYVDKVSVQPSALALSSGIGTRMGATAHTPNNEPIEVPLRWSTLDSTVAQVDETGFVRGRRPGATRLVASAGGFRADTVDVSVAYEQVDTLMYEDWGSGIDTLKWTYFGNPRSRLVSDVTPERRTVFLNNGDYNHGSGVVSVAEFEVETAGLTLEAEAWANLDGRHWQIWQIGLLAGRPSVLEGELSPSNMFGFEGHNPTRARLIWGCASLLSGSWELDFINRSWHTLAIQIRPDGYAECFVDNALVARGAIPDDTWNDALAVVLRGHSEDASEVYHGRVVLTRGLRH